MRHPGPAVLVAHADGELPEHAAGEVARHIAACTACEAMISDLRIGGGSFGGALALLDAAEPAEWGQSSEPGHRRDEAVLPLRPRPGRARVTPRSSGMLRWAAGILLVTSATAAAAVVGVRVLSGTADPAVTSSGEQAAEPHVAAVIVRPLDGVLNLDVTGAGAGARLFIVLDDRSTASVAVEGDTPPRFRTIDGRIDVDLSGASAVVRLTLPRTLRRGIITTDGVTRAMVQGERVSPADALSDDGLLLPGR